MLVCPGHISAKKDGEIVGMNKKVAKRLGVIEDEYHTNCPTFIALAFGIRWDFRN